MFSSFLLCLNLNLSNFASEKETPQQENKYPDYAYQYVGNDKCENFNKKMFVFNMKLNKFVIRPIYIVWASVMPKYGVQRLQNAYDDSLLVTAATSEMRFSTILTRT